MTLPRSLIAESRGGLKPYPAMKGSGVKWLGDVPEHWDVKRTKSVLSRNESGVWGQDSTDEGVIVVRSTEQTVTGEWNITAPARRQLTSPEYDAFRLKEGDLVVTKSSGSALHIGKTAIVTKEVEALDCCFSNFMQRLRVRQGTLARFVWYYLNGDMGRKQFDYLSDTTTGLANLNGEIIGKVVLPSPPLAEQNAIVRFLDHADRRIMRYVRAKQELIALLEEQRRVLVHTAVTRGVEAATKQEATGDAWFPEAPAHWDVMPMRRVIASSLDGPHHSPEYLDQGIPFLSARNIRVDRWSLEDVKFISRTDYETFCQRVKPAVGDVLYTKGGTTGIARAVDLDYPFQVWVHVAVLKLREERILPRFLAAALNSPRCYEQSQLLTRGATNQDLGLGRMKEIVLPVPPLAEQSDIIEHVAEVEDRLGRARATALREIELVREYRSRLIADVVTGKVDVRGVGAGRPELDTLVGDHALGGGAPDDVSDSASDLAGRDDFETLARDERNGPEEREAQP